MALWNRRGPVDTQRFGCFVDPARRRAGGSHAAREQWSPPLSWVRSLAGRVPATGAKVAPGIDHAALPTGDVRPSGSASGATCVECLRVVGAPARRSSDPQRHCHGDAAGRRAHASASDAGGDPEPSGGAHLDDADGIPVPAVGQVGAWLVEPDPAVIRSGLVSVLAARIGRAPARPRIAYIAVDRADPAAGAARQRVRRSSSEVPFGRKPLRACLRRAGYGDVVVKKRGVNVVPEQLRADLRLGGDGPPATLILTRTDAGPLALLVERVPAPQQAGSGALGDQRRHGLGELGDGRL